MIGKIAWRFYGRNIERKTTFTTVAPDIVLVGGGGDGAAGRCDAGKLRSGKTIRR